MPRSDDFARASSEARGLVLSKGDGLPPGVASSSKAAFLGGGGEMGERIRAFDWASTPLGAPETWPQSLRSAVTLCLGSRFPTVIWWGRQELIQLYNDACVPFLGQSKHPAYLGRSGRECWQEIWPTMGPAVGQGVRDRRGGLVRGFSLSDQPPSSAGGDLRHFSYGAIRGRRVASMGSSAPAMKPPPRWSARGGWRRCGGLGSK